MFEDKKILKLLIHQLNLICNLSIPDIERGGIPYAELDAHWFKSWPYYRYVELETGDIYEIK